MAYIETKRYGWLITKILFSFNTSYHCSVYCYYVTIKIAALVNTDCVGFFASDVV